MVAEKFGADSRIRYGIEARDEWDDVVETTLFVFCLRCSFERSTIAFVFFFSKGVTRDVLYTYLFPPAGIMNLPESFFLFFFSLTSSSPLLFPLARGEAKVFLELSSFTVKLISLYKLFVRGD